MNICNLYIFIHYDALIALHKAHICFEYCVNKLSCFEYCVNESMLSFELIRLNLKVNMQMPLRTVNTIQLCTNQILLICTFIKL